MNPTSADYDPLAPLADDFLARHRKGEQPSPEEYASRHPHLASQIREVFRRINSYTIPLNAEEQRHAKFQGIFKWFLHRLALGLDYVWEMCGVFSEKQLVRMADNKLFAEICPQSFPVVVRGTGAAGSPHRFSLSPRDANALLNLERRILSYNKVSTAWVLARFSSNARRIPALRLR